MTVTNIARARHTLERIRVKALHNEFSGAGRYFDNAKVCQCVIGTLMPADMLRDILSTGKNGMAIDSLYVGMGRADEILALQTGLPAATLATLQIEHDEACYRYDTGHDASKREIANDRLRIWAEASLSRLL